MSKADSVYASFDETDLQEAEASLALLFSAADRYMRVWWVRNIAINNRPTVRALGRTLNVTGSRIQQMEVKGGYRVQRYLAEFRAGAMGRVCQALGDELGSAFPVTHLGRPEVGIDPTIITREAVMNSAELRSQMGLLLVYLSGYRKADEWLVRENLDVLGDLLAQLQDIESPYLSVEDATLKAHELGVGSNAFQYLLEHDASVKIICGKVCPWPATAEARAEVLLRAHGVPLHKREIARAIGRHPGTVINLLTSSSKFYRVDFDMVALSEWGIPEFRGIIPAMKTAIERYGGVASKKQIMEDLLGTLPISASSIGVYLGTHHFVRVGKGQYRVRRNEEEISASTFPPPELVKNAFFRRGDWRVRLDVDGNRIRGSGGPLPRFFASQIGIEPGDSRLFPLVVGKTVGAVKISWPSQSLTIGSVSSAVRHLSLMPGDFLFLRWDAKRGCVVAEGAHLPGCAEKTECCVKRQILTRIGYPDNASGDVLKSVAIAVGLGTVVDRVQLVARLRKRQDDEMIRFYRVLHDLQALRSQDRIERREHSRKPKAAVLRLK